MHSPIYKHWNYTKFRQIKLILYCRYIQLMADIRYPLRRDEFLREVQFKILQKDGRPSPFPNNLPGKGWYYLFKTRNPDIVERVPQPLGKHRACISLEMIANWYSNLNRYLKQEVQFKPTLCVQRGRINQDSCFASKATEYWRRRHLVMYTRW